MKFDTYDRLLRKCLTAAACKLLNLLGRINSKGTKESVADLLPAWMQLVSNIGDANPQTDTELCSSARLLLLKSIPQESWFLLPSLERNNEPVMNTWTYQNNVAEWNIGPDDMVLDVGFGGWPFKRANHLADRYPEETSHRMEAIARDSRPFIQVDIEKLPFRGSAYDFIFCSHVLEHLDNPGQAIRELMRVGRRGYIEVPTRLSDVMFNFTRLTDHHRWHGLVLGKTLVLIEWNERERRDLGNHYFNSLHSEYNNQFQTFFENNRDLFFASFHWVGTIEFMIIDKQGRIIDSSGGKL